MSTKNLFYDDLEAAEKRLDQELNKVGFITTYEIPVMEDGPSKSKVLAAVSKKLQRNLVDFKVDEQNKKVAFCNYQRELLDIFSFTDLRRCEIIKDNQITNQVGINRSILGAAVGGAAGAVIASTPNKSKTELDRLKLIVYTNNLKNPRYEFSMRVSKMVPKDKWAFVHWVEKVFATLEIIISQNTQG